MITDFFLTLLFAIPHYLTGLWHYVLGSWTMPTQVEDVLRLLFRAERWWDWLIDINYINTLILAYLGLVAGLWIIQQAKRLVGFFRGYSMQDDLITPIENGPAGWGNYTGGGFKKATGYQLYAHQRQQKELNKLRFKGFKNRYNKYH